MTRQGKRSKAAPLQLPADVCPAAQKSQMLRWKQQGLQVLNHHDQCANAQDLMVRELLSASTTMFFSFRRRSHAWILWANVEHGRLEYLFKWQAHQWLGEAEVAIAAMGAQEVMPGSKRPCDTLRTTPPKRVRPACSSTRGVMPPDAILMPDDGRLEWLVPMCAVDPPASDGLAAPGPPDPTLLLSPPRRNMRWNTLPLN